MRFVYLVYGASRRKTGVIDVFSSLKEAKKYVEQISIFWKDNYELNKEMSKMWRDIWQYDYKGDEELKDIVWPYIFIVRKKILNKASEAEVRR